MDGEVELTGPMVRTGDRRGTRRLARQATRSASVLPLVLDRLSRVPGLSRLRSGLRGHYSGLAPYQRSS